MTHRGARDRVPGGMFMVRIQAGEGGRAYIGAEDQGSSWEGTFGEIESPHGLYLLRSLSASAVPADG